MAAAAAILRLTSKYGPLEQLTVVTESLNRLAPGMEELAHSPCKRKVVGSNPAYPTIFLGNGHDDGDAVRHI